MVAGHFTAAGLCSYLLVQLATDPYAARLREGLLAHQDPDIASLEKMPLLDHAVMEAQRLVSPVSHLPRGIAAEMQFRDCRFAAGELLLCSVAGTHADVSIFPDPQVFEPGRFAPPRSEHRRDPLALAAFGGGGRRCIGAFLAEVMIKIIVHHVLRGYAMAPGPEAYAPSVSMPILHPENPMPVHLTALGTR